MALDNKMLAGGNGMSPRKNMAGASGGGDFGVSTYPGKGKLSGRHSPDAAMGTAEKGAMDDGMRGVGAPIHHSKDHMPAQAAPDHGPAHERTMGHDYGSRKAY